MASQMQTGQNVDYVQVFQILSDGLEELLKGLKASPEAKLKSYTMEIENLLSFLDTLGFIQETMSNERLRETLQNSIRSMRKTFFHIPRKILVQQLNVEMDAKSGLPQFLVQAIQLLGPHIRVSSNGMTAYVMIETQDEMFFDEDLVFQYLNNVGITHGIKKDVIRDLFTERQFDEEVCVAKGKLPTKGKDGRIEYTLHVDDLNYKPKEVDQHKVSYKDINLYEYIQAGGVLAKKIPPVSGKSGYTVLGREIPAREPQAAQFPQMNYTKISDDDLHLVATEDCCITKREGVIHLEPALKISESISYKTGNISTKVSVIVNGDVLTGFSIKTEKDIHVGKIVEGAYLEAKEAITVLGGVQGKGKAVLEANGDITAKFIANATANSLNSITAETEITHSQINAGEDVVVSGHPGNIVGGEIIADSNVIASNIGSELGVKTVIRLGGRAEDIASMIIETQEKIAEQEEALDKCHQVLDILKQRQSQFDTPQDDIEESRKRAQEMLEKAQKNLEELHQENDGLQAQYDNCLRKSRTVRARHNIFPGTIVEIQGVEFEVKKPTGPAIFVKQGDEIVQFPYQELPKDKKAQTR